MNIGSGPAMQRPAAGYKRREDTRRVSTRRTSQKKNSLGSGVAPSHQQYNPAPQPSYNPHQRDNHGFTDQLPSSIVNRRPSNTDTAPAAPVHGGGGCELLSLINGIIYFSQSCTNGRSRNTFRRDDHRECELLPLAVLSDFLGSCTSTTGAKTQTTD